MTSTRTRSHNLGRSDMLSTLDPEVLASRGPVVEETITRPWYDGPHVRLRCTTCDKVAKMSREDADRAVEKIGNRWPMMVYLGKCGWWHLATKRGH